MKQTLILAVLLVLSAAPMAVRADRLVICNVGGIIEEQVQQLYPIAHYVAEKLGFPDPEATEVYYANSLETVIKGVNSQQIHWVTESPYAASVLMQQADMIPLLKRNKYQQSSYRSLLVSDNSISSVSELLGKKIAVEAPSSFSGYVLVVQHLSAQGLPISFLDTAHQRANPLTVNLVFSHRAVNSSEWLNSGLVDAAAFNGSEYHDEILMPQSLIQKTHVLYRSPSFPRAIELVSSTLPQQTQEAVRSILLSASAQPKAQAALRAYHHTTVFEPMSEQEVAELKKIAVVPMPAVTSTSLAP